MRKPVTTSDQIAIDGIPEQGPQPSRSRSGRGRSMNPTVVSPSDFAHLDDPGTAFLQGTRARGRAAVSDCVDVLVDAAGRVGLLSYLLPAGVWVQPGDALVVPFGSRTVLGTAVRSGDLGKATKSVHGIVGARSTPVEVDLALAVTTSHFCTDVAALSRLSPRRHLTSVPAGGFPQLLQATATLGKLPSSDAARRLYLRHPATRGEPVAVAEALRLAQNGQVLVLCPTLDSVQEVLDLLEGPVVRLDAQAPAGHWAAFAAGKATIGVGTRSSALYHAPDLAGIVVVDEDHPGHLEAASPRTHARDIASARARARKVSLTLISALPSPQALHATTVVLTVGRAAQAPRMLCIDRARLDPHQGSIPTAVQAALSRAVRAGRSPVLVAPHQETLRRCVTCGHPRACTTCEETTCRHADRTPCPRCSSSDGVRTSGWSPRRLSALVDKNVRVITSSGLDDVQDAGLVVIFDIDRALGRVELIAQDTAARLLVSAARAAGESGTVMVGTLDTAQPLLRELVNGRGFLPHARRCLAAAKKADLPPFARLVSIAVSCTKAPSTAGVPGQISGPSLRSGQWQMLIRIPAGQLGTLASFVARMRRRGQTRVLVS